MKNKIFDIGISSDTGDIKSIILNDDEYAMNWCGQTHSLGEIFLMRYNGTYEEVQTGNFNAPIIVEAFDENETGTETVYNCGKLRVRVKRNFVENGNLRECYVFTNISNSELFCRKGEVGIYTPFCDEYVSAGESLTKKCHAHVWCGENASYVNALRQGVSDKNLGLVLTDGSINCYRIDRENQKLGTAVRGNIILCPEIPPLLPGEEYTIAWEIFEHKGNDDFKKITAHYDALYDIQADFYTIFEGEKFRFCLPYSDELEILCGNAVVPYVREGEKAVVSHLPQKYGEHKFIIKRGGKQTHVSMYNAGNFEKLIKARIDYIIDKQQYHRKGSKLDGAYLIYDTKDDYLYFNDDNSDHNATRERLGMALTITRYLQTHDDPNAEASLDKFIEFAFREFIDEETGEVYNTVGKNPNAKRLYNAPWAMMFCAELYRLKKDEKYLDILSRIIEHYYSLGGTKFYPNAVDFKFLYDTLVLGGRKEKANKAFVYFKEHVDNMLKVGLNYPPHEVVYEQTIVTPAVTCICNMGLLLNDKSYVEKVNMHHKTLELFSGMQPDYRFNGIPIRYWDDYWFGKEALFGDTLHYWSCLTARSDFDYYNLSGDEKYKKKAEICARNCLCLFSENGSASCAYVSPYAVDTHRGEFFDEWANDQDFALYFCMQILN